MRARNIKPGFWENEELGKLTHTQRLLLIGLWCLADREGRLEDRLERIKHLLFGYDKRPPEISGDLKRLEETFIIRYACNGNAYIQVKNFKKHQTPHHQEKQSIIPEYQGAVRSPEISDVNERFVPDIRNPDSLNPDVPDKTKHTKKRFQKPTPTEVSSYAKTINFTLDGEYFCNYYSARGWKLKGQPMVSWKHTVSTWKKNNYDSGKLNETECPI